MHGIASAAKEVVRSRNSGYPDMEAVEQSEIGAHVLDSMVYQSNRRTLSRSAVTLILQRAEAAWEETREATLTAQPRVSAEPDYGYEAV